MVAAGILTAQTMGWKMVLLPCAIYALALFVADARWRVAPLPAPPATRRAPGSLS